MADEIDQLTASMSLRSGVQTDDVSVDLVRNERSSQVAGPRGRRGIDFTDSTQSNNNIKVSTYIQSEKIQLFVRTQQGGSQQNITIAVLPTAYVEKVKDIVAEKTRIHRGEFWLEFNGTRLSEEMPLSFYRVENNSHLTQRLVGLRGG